MLLAGDVIIYVGKNLTESMKKLLKLMNDLASFGRQRQHSKINHAGFVAQNDTAKHKRP
jgi:hypothetical protein